MDECTMDRLNPTRTVKPFEVKHLLQFDGARISDVSGPSISRKNGGFLVFNFLVWIPIVGGVVALGIFLPGYLILKIFPFPNRLDSSDIVVFSFGIGLLTLPLSIYWANVLGLTIDLQGVSTVIALLLSTALTCNIFLIILRRTNRSKSIRK
jgi:hypothetical protein